MERTFNYEDISIKDIENNPHLIFICDGDRKERNDDLSIM